MWSVAGLLISLALGACISRQGQGLSSTPVPTVEEAQALTAAAPRTPEGPGEETITYAVVWVSPGDFLTVRQPAGISGDPIAELPANARGLRLTGQQTRLGSSLWVELALDDGRLGWVNAWNLTESVAPEEFCRQIEVAAMLAGLRDAILRKDGEAFARWTHPMRGLVLRHDLYNPDLVFPPADVPGLFSNQEELHWGKRADSDLEIRGTFAQTFLPLLEDVFFKPHKLRCNEMAFGETQAAVNWPPELASMNFYSLFRPSPAGGNPFDWRGLALGVEFFQGEPYLSLIIHYTSELSGPE
jgi:hypothetical protein